MERETHAREPYDYLLLTALAEEDAALTEALQAVKAEGPHRAKYAGAPTGLQWGVEHALGRLRVLTVTIHGMGEEKAREWTRLLLNSVAPQYVGLVGIAGAAALDAQFGDILIADRIWYYEQAKVEPSGTDYRGPEHRSEGLLIDRLRNPDLDKIRQLFPDAGQWSRPRVGVIASGEKVIANDSLKADLLRAKWNIVGFEMEGHGFANEVIRALGSERWFMVRSVSDHADCDKSNEHRLTACRRAAQYSVGFMLDSDLCVPHDSAVPAKRALDHAPAARPGDAPLSGLLNSMALAFAERSPDDFLALLRRSEGEPLPIALRMAEASAHWRRDDATACLRACREVLDGLATDDLSSNPAMVATRLSAWSLLRLGRAAQARDLLEKGFARVTDVSERGRWADLLAQSCRFSDDEAYQVLSLSWYAQARRLKAEGRDHFGEVIALQQMARVCLERLDVDGCEVYYRDAAAVASAHDYPQRVTCEITSLLGLAWLDLIRRGDLHLRLARRRLSMAGALLRDLSIGALERDLQAAASAMSKLLDVLMGGRTSVTGWQNVSAMWACVVYGQARVLCGEELESVTRDVIQQAKGRPSIAPRAIPALLAMFRPTAAPPRDPEFSLPECAFWPLSDWVRAAGPGEGVRVIEGLVSIYSLIIDSLDATPRLQLPDPPAGLDSLVTALSHYGHSHPKLAIAREVAAVATIIRQAIPARNRWAHALPGESGVKLSEQLDRFAGSALREARMLRSAAWIDGTAIVIGDTRINLAPAVTWHADERIREIRFRDRTSYSTRTPSDDSAADRAAAE